ncbi:uncharacterized protein [Asterias amurensis]|uniref:uncharacterized protein n=1 Tax=Asterias amurensis TaxID=7602 RepID=UPI003AB50AC8
MPFAKTSTLLLALFSGFAALVLNAVAVGSPYWTQTDFTGSVRNYYVNETADNPVPVLIRNRGLWLYCGFVLNPNYTADFSTEDIIPSAQSSQEPLDALVECVVYNFTSSIKPNAPGATYLSIRFYTEKCAAIIACAALAMQFCAAMTSIQGTWTMLTVLFTDCGIMFLIGAVFSLMSSLCFMISFTYGTHQVPAAFPPLPTGYVLNYSWSFFIAWGSFALTVLSGTLYLLIARAWHLEEVWVKAEVEKPGGKKEETVSSRRKLMGKL